MTVDASESTSTRRMAGAAKEQVSLSKWVNESLPDWNEILSARDVARLTRRSCWYVHALALLGRFPKRRRFHGCAIGWGKHDVLRWLAEGAAYQRPFGGQRRLDSSGMFQRALPIHFPRTRRSHGPCKSTRKGGKS
jgi:predicted DNA-binding transcriptional regulator AlpA